MKEQSDRPQLKFHNLTEEAADDLCVFVVVPNVIDPNTLHVLYSNCGKERETHVYLYDLGVEEEIVDEDSEPIGGGVLYRCLDYRPSFYYGDVTDGNLRDRIIQILCRKFEQ